MKLLPTITTTADWREKIKECDDLGLNEVCFFPTGISLAERQEAYGLLKNSTIKKIPFVHLRSDMSSEEINFLMDNFGTEFFNIHVKAEYPLKYDLSHFYNHFYLENTSYPISEEEIRNFAGLCFDVSHLEARRVQGSPLYEKHLATLRSYPIGCGHISAVSLTPLHIAASGRVYYDLHHYTDLAQFDYLTRYKDLLPPLAALELTNTIAEQLKAKEYIENILQ